MAHLRAVKTKVITAAPHDPVDAFTMGGIVRDAGMTAEEFRRLVWQATARDVPGTPPTPSARKFSRRS